MWYIHIIIIIIKSYIQFTNISLECDFLRGIKLLARDAARQSTSPEGRARSLLLFAYGPLGFRKAPHHVRMDFRCYFFRVVSSLEFVVVRVPRIWMTIRTIYIYIWVPGCHLVTGELVTTWGIYCFSSYESKLLVIEVVWLALGFCRTRDCLFLEPESSSSVLFLIIKYTY